MSCMEFETIYETYYNKIFSYVKKRISHLQDAQEITSDIFTNVYKGLASYNPNKSSLETWLFVITNNRLKNYYRDKKDEIIVDEVEQFYIDRELSAEELMIVKEQREELLQCLMQLSVRERTIVIKKYYQGETSAQIADELDLTAGNVRIILKRSLAKLRGLMNDRNI